MWKMYTNCHCYVNAHSPKFNGCSLCSTTCGKMPCTDALCCCCHCFFAYCVRQAQHIKTCRNNLRHIAMNLGSSHLHKSVQKCIQKLQKYFFNCLKDRQCQWRRTPWKKKGRPWFFCLKEKKLPKHSAFFSKIFFGLLSFCFVCFCFCLTFLWLLAPRTK